MSCAIKTWGTMQYDALTNILRESPVIWRDSTYIYNLARRKSSDTKLTRYYATCVADSPFKAEISSLNPSSSTSPSKSGILIQIIRASEKAHLDQCRTSLNILNWRYEDSSTMASISGAATAIGGKRNVI